MINWGIEEEEALSKVIMSDKWGTFGPFVNEFNEKFKAWLGADYGFAVPSGTTAIELILRGLGIGYGDEVIVPPHTFSATVAAVAYTGALPVFADITLPDCNIDYRDIEKKITAKTRAVIAVHVGGLPCDMDNINRVAKKNGIYVIEDAAHSHGAMLKGKKAGTLGDAAAFSFQNSKNLTCGEGGYISTNNKDIYAECWHYHNSGRTLDDGSEFGGQTRLGTNARMNEFCAAILLEQLKRLDTQIEKITENAKYLTSRLEKIPGIIIPNFEAEGMVHGLHIYTIMLDEEYAQNRDELISALNAQGVPICAGYGNLAREGFLMSDYFCKVTGSEVDYRKVSLPNADIAAGSIMWIFAKTLLADRSEIEDIAKKFEDATASFMRKKTRFIEQP